MKKNYFSEKKTFFWKDSLSESTRIGECILKNMWSPSVYEWPCASPKSSTVLTNVCQSLLRDNKAYFHKYVTKETELKFILYFTL